MNKVIIINLNGNAYQLEEDGFDALRAYLDNARGRLEGNPDRDEIIADIEQAIADKFRSLLGTSKTVILGREVSAVIAEMGPVEDAGGNGEARPGADKPFAGGTGGAPGAPTPGAPTAKRLYKIHDGAMLWGVCNGLAAYMNIDVTIIRLVFVLVTFFYGVGALAYLVLAVLLPFARTPEDKAAAFGPPPTAQDFIRRARAGYYEGMKTFGDRAAHREWRRKFRQEMRDWKREMRDDARRWSVNWRFHWMPHPGPMPGSWILYPVLTAMSLLVTLTGVYAIIMLLATGNLFGIPLPADIPMWLAIVLIFVAYNLIKWPIKAMRYSFYLGGPPGSYVNPFAHALNSLVGLAIFAFFLWIVFRHPSEFHEAVRNLPHAAHDAVHAVKEWWDKQ